MQRKKTWNKIARLSLFAVLIFTIILGVTLTLSFMRVNAYNINDPNMKPFINSNNINDVNNNGFNPILNFNANSENVDTTVVLTAVATDSGSNAGIKWIRIYGDGSLLQQKNCDGLTSCTFVKTVIHTQEGYHNYYALAMDKDNNKVTSQTINIYFYGSNHNPTLNIPDQTLNEDTILTVQLDGYSGDVDGDSLNYNILNGSICSLSGQRNETLTIQPEANWNGQTYCDVVALDNKGGSAVNRFYITIMPVDDAPTLDLPNSVNFDEDTFYELDLSQYTGDIDNAFNELTWQVSGNNHVHISIANGIANFTADKDWNGQETLTFTVSDPDGLSASDNLIVIVNPVNDAPVLRGAKRIIQEDSDPVHVDLWQYTYDVDSNLDGMGYTILNQTNTSVANCYIDKSVHHGIQPDADLHYITCEPKSNAYGSNIVSIEVKDAGQASSIGNFSLLITPVNDAPQWSQIPNVMFDEDTSYQVDLDNYVSDVDNPNNELTLNCNSNNPNVMLTLDGHVMNVSASQNWYGNALGTCTATDPNGLTDTVTFNIIVNPVNDIPVIQILQPATGSVFSEYQTVHFEANAFDVEDGNLNASIMWASSINGNIGTGNIINTNLSVGIHTITASVTDSNGATSTGSIILTIQQGPGVNQIVLWPNPVYTVDNINCNATLVGGEPTLTAYYKWYINGIAVLNGSTTVNNNENTLITTLPPLYTTKHDNVTCEITPAYSLVNGTTSNATIEVQNSAPVMQTLNISPTTVYVGTTITASATATDDDNDSLIIEYRFENVNDSTFQNWSTNNTYVVQTNDAHDTINIMARAYDRENYSNVMQQSIVVQNSQPTINLVSPLSGSLINASSVTLQWNASDNDNDVLTFYAYINGQLNITTTLQNLTQNYADGFYEWHVIVNDGFTNVTSETRNFTIDTLAPVIIINSPINGTWYNTTNLALNTTITDDHLDSCWYNINGGVNITYDCNTADLSSGVVEGANNLNVYANDTLSHISASSIMFYVDTMMPFVNVIEPSNGSWQNGTITIRMNASDNQQVSSVDLFNNGWQSTTLESGTQQNGIWNYSLDTTTIADCSTFSLAARATDQAGNTAYDNDTIIYVDNTAPVITYVNVNDFVVQAGSTIYVESDGQDPCGLTSCYSRLYDSNDNYITGSSQNLGTDCDGDYNLLPSLTDGTYYLKVRARNNVDMDSWANTTIIIDNTQPSVQIIEPANNSYHNNQNVNLTFVATDNYATQLNCTYNVDSQSYDAGTINNNTQTILLMAGLTDGQHQVYVSCVDDADNIGVSETIFFNVDTVIPSLTIISPQNMTYNHQDILVNISAQDNNLDTVWYNWNGMNVTYTRNVTITFPEGHNVLEAWANDSAGNLAYSNVMFTVDLAGPNVTITKPQENETLSVRDVNVEFTSVDALSSVDSCWYNLRNSTALVSSGNIAGCNNFTLYNLTNENYTLTIYSNDTVSNIGSDSVDFTVIKDDVAPFWFNENVVPSSPALYGTGPYNFSIQWQDNFNVDTVIFEFNNQDYTPTCNPTLPATSTTCWFIFNDLAAGNHTYRWYANDTSNNWNSTPSFLYEINKANSTITLFLNGSDSDMTINQTQDVNITTTLTPASGTINTYENGSLLVSGTSPLTIIKSYNVPGYYNITSVFNGNENSTSSQATHFITVLDSTPPVITLISPNDSAEMDAPLGKVNVTFSYSVHDDYSGIQSCSLYINGSLNQTNTNVTEDTIQSFEVELGPGSYKWFVKCTDNSPNNNTDQSENRTLKINYHDLAVSNVKTNASLTTWIYDALNVTADVINNGNVNENNIQVMLKVNGNVVDTQLVNVTTGSTQLVSFLWQANPKGNDVIAVEVNFSDGNLSNNKDETTLTVWSVKDVINETEFKLQFDNANPSPNTNFTMAYEIDEIYPGNNTFYNLKIKVTTPSSMTLYECISRSYNNWSCEPESGPEPQLFNITNGYDYYHYRKINAGSASGTFPITIMAGNNEINDTKYVNVA